MIIYSIRKCLGSTPPCCEATLHSLTNGVQGEALPGQAPRSPTYFIVQQAL
jgi:hypothetical protein